MQNHRFLLTKALAPIVAAFFSSALAQAGTEISSGKEKVLIDPAEDKLPYGTITFGGKFSEELQTGYIDSLTPFWDPGDFVFFLNTRSKWSDNGQTISSYGLGGRYLVPGREIILGANAYYDGLHSLRGNDFDQLGVGVELLTRWFDARANWYLPDDHLYEVGTSSRSDGEIGVVGNFRDGDFFKRRINKSSSRTFSKQYEGALEGYNLEAGFLVPGVDRYFELRILAGYYNYTGPFDKGFEGLKARVEARFLPGLIADVEYWDDEELMGGHWTGELRVSIPFSIFNLANGRNPFEGTAEMFQPRQREFRERLSEQVHRSHTVQTSTSGSVGAGSSSTNSTTDVVTGPVPKPPVKRVGGAPPPPDITEGEGSSCQ